MRVASFLMLGFILHFPTRYQAQRDGGYNGQRGDDDGQQGGGGGGGGGGGYGVRLFPLLNSPVSFPSSLISLSYIEKWHRCFCNQLPPLL